MISNNRISYGKIKINKRLSHAKKGYKLHLRRLEKFDIFFNYFLYNKRHYKYATCDLTAKFLRVQVTLL